MKEAKPVKPPMKANPAPVTVTLTRKQAGFLHMLLDGFICREAGLAIGTPSIIRKTSQIGKRLSKAAGFRWPHNAR